ncbi:MAG: peptidase S8, partial [Chloroflexi bacterium]|nr:peptidase S8 [Chloroflexota bacterium]
MQQHTSRILFFTLVVVLAVLVAGLGAARASERRSLVEPPPRQLASVSSAQAEFAPGRLLIQFRERRGPERAALMAEYGLTYLRTLEGLDVEIVEVEPGRELALAEELSRLPGVRFAEPDYYLHAIRGQVTTPNDIYYDQYQWQLPHIRADEAWDVTTGSSGVTIAIVDTGVDLTHPDLASKIVAGYDFINNDNDPSDDEGHGTHVASIAAAASNNNEGVAGVSWGAQIMPVKTLDYTGSGSLSQVADGIRWAADNGADIINLSLGGSSASSTLESAVNYAYGKGALLVAAMGNEYQSGNPTNYPAAYNHVLAVAATDDNDGHASYSNSGSHADVSAPGGDPTSNSDGNPRHWIIGAYWRGYSPSGYAWLAGTSQAAPHVAGLAALLLSVNSSLTPDQLESIIVDTAVDVQAPGWDEFSGYGRIDALAAVNEALSMLTPTATPTSPFTSTPTATPAPTST